MNLPNQLTVSRLVLTVLFLAALLVEFPHHETAALGFFVVASLTDYFDGMIARREKLITNFGTLMDPLADKILVCSAFIAFVDLGQMPGWMVIVIVARELAITGLRLLAAARSVVLGAERYGKHKTISQITCIIAVLTSLSYPHWGAWARALFEFPIITPWVVWFTAASKWVAVVLTLFSGTVYLWRNRRLYLDDI